MRIEKVTCDGCGVDLTTRTNSVDYRLVLAAESKPGYGSGFYTGMMIWPPVERTHHFCDLACLDQWRNRENHSKKLWEEWWDSWKAEHGSKDIDGRVRSYPAPSEETLAPFRTKFEEAALAAFPMKRPR